MFSKTDISNIFTFGSIDNECMRDHGTLVEKNTKNIKLSQTGMSREINHLNGTSGLNVSDFLRFSE